MRLSSTTLGDFMAASSSLASSLTMGSGVPAADIGRYVDLYKMGKLPVDRLLGQAFTLDQVNEGFDHLASGSGLRDCIVFS